MIVTMVDSNDPEKTTMEPIAGGGRGLEALMYVGMLVALIKLTMYRGGETETETEIGTAIETSTEEEIAR